jgi:hypothetical protein
VTGDVEVVLYHFDHAGCLKRAADRDRTDIISLEGVSVGRSVPHALGEVLG